MRAHEFISEGRRGLNNTNHIIYVILNKITKEEYIGITLAGKDAEHSLKIRWQKHAQRARVEGRNWTLCKAIRKYGEENFSCRILERVRGKLKAHRREHEIIGRRKPALNVAHYEAKE